jgi:prephenate dehydrogenase
MSVSVVTVIGLGLIGGSVAAAAKRSGRYERVRGVDSDEQACAGAVARGFVDEAASPESAECDGWLSGGAGSLVVLATPVHAAVQWLERLRDLGFTGTVTDVASTKRSVVEAAERAGAAYRFVGGHPMAGSERSGIAHADPALFDGAYYILTPLGSTDTEAYRDVHTFVTSLGARVLAIDPRTHDEAVAVVSHVPHVVAAALTRLASAGAEEAGADLLRLAAGGFKDMTRIAAGSPELWTGICAENASAIVAGLDRFAAQVKEFRDTLASGDATAVREWLAAAAEVRRSLPAQWVPASTRLRELTVPVEDRPGMVGLVTTAVSRAGCNIEDIEIDHRSEDRATLRLVLTDEGDLDALQRELEAEGFHAQVRWLEAGDA